MRAVILSTLLLAGGPALAQDGNGSKGNGGGPARDAVLTSISPAEVQAVVEGSGVQVQLTKDNAGDPLLNVKSEGLNYQVLFYGCENDRCSSIQFRAWWSVDRKIDSAALHKYEVERRYGRVYLDKDDDPTIEVNVWMKPGVTYNFVHFAHDSFLQGARELSTRL